MSTPKISIIVPVYNVEQYLRQCLDSILAQTFTNWEGILVDDGSTDDSGKICDEYAEKDSRVKVVHKKNGGVSSARNVGIGKAKGEWLFFSDADDTLECCGLQILLSEIDMQTDFVMGGYSKYSEKGNIKESYPVSAFHEISVEGAIKELYQSTELSYQGYLWCKLFKTEVIKENDICFNENIFFNEDRLFIIQYLCRITGKIQYSTTPVYNYLERSSGAMQSLKRGYNCNFATDFDAFVLMKKLVYDYSGNCEIRKMALNKIVDSYILNHSLMCQHHDYVSSIHCRMLIQLFKTGAYKRYLIRVFFPIMLLLFPWFICKRK